MKRKIEEFPYLKNALSYILAGLILLVAYFLFKNFDGVIAEIRKFLDILTPFIYGLVIAFLLSPLVTWFELRGLAFLKIPPRIVHILAVILTLGLSLGILVLFFSFIIPQLITSLVLISEKMPAYLEELRKYLSPFMQSMNLKNDWLDLFFSSSEDFLARITGLLQTYLPDIVNYSVQLSKTFFNLILAMTLAVYLMLGDQAFVRQYKKLVYALAGQKWGDEIVNLTHLTSFMLHRFILGKALNSLILGLLCYIVMLITGMEFPVFMSAVIGVTNMIPFFGPFLGGAFGALILLLENPIHALWFILLASALQQIEGSILSPWLIGDSMGLPGLWVMFAIIVGGGYFGIAGMFLGVPFFAVLYLLSKRFLDQRIEDQHLSIK